VTVGAATEPVNCALDVSPSVCCAVKVACSVQDERSSGSGHVVAASAKIMQYALLPLSSWRVVQLIGSAATLGTVAAAAEFGNAVHIAASIHDHTPNSAVPVSLVAGKLVQEGQSPPSRTPRQLEGVVSGSIEVACRVHGQWPLGAAGDAPEEAVKHDQGPTARAGR